jgi:hypothetical protein
MVKNVIFSMVGMCHRIHIFFVRDILHDVIWFPMSAHTFLLRQSFLIYGVGMGFAVMAFLGEHISKACLTKWRVRKEKVAIKSLFAFGRRQSRLW